nr:MAG TPA: hypothetical protein [Caudoviricetes sp.]
MYLYLSTVFHEIFIVIFLTKCKPVTVGWGNG